MPSSTESIAYLSLGSNQGDMLGDREAHIEAAIEAIGRIPTTKVLRRSPYYESKAWGYTNQPDFLNLALEISTKLLPHQLLRHAQNIEKEQGRVEGEKWGPRPIDIDILIFGDRRIKTATLVVPHPHMWQRQFVLRPLSDLRPDLVSPDGKPIKDMLKEEAIASQDLWGFEEPRKSQNESNQE
jgi:2-amino-4-hydroxy-6-hydroxymethyldihydropteridine diphosphokinase